MLKEVIDLQENAVSQLVKQISQKNEITFKAPTGSGKTYMMADFMNRILEDNPNVIFLVSSLSKGNLAAQNYDKFLKYVHNGNFSKLNPYLINTIVSSEETLFIPNDYNVYILPRDLYKDKGLLMRGAMLNFLDEIINPLFGLGKQIYLIKDECHIKTTNLDSISKDYFTKIINFSATPNLNRGQTPDVEIKEDEAVQAKLIKYVEYGNDDDSVVDALNKFQEIKSQYRNLLHVNPCLIIQISNKDKADEELKNTILPALNDHQDLKWMLIVDDKNNGSETNDVFKVKKLPMTKWRDYAKENTSTIDVIIFKMVISEGWDIPRACMLYQVRDTKSKQLDEQVIGRVRRNPRLLDFENLSEEAKKLAMTAWVWGIVDYEKTKCHTVKLYGEPTDITNEIKLKTTRLKNLTEKVDFDIEKFMDSKKILPKRSNIFEMYKKLNKCDGKIIEMCYKYADTVDKWWKFVDNLDDIKSQYNNYICDYSKSMETIKDEEGKEILSSFPITSFYIDNGNYVQLSDWVWKKRSGSNKFSFDSYAEMEWVRNLEKLSYKDAGNEQKVIKKVVCGKDNPASQALLKGMVPDKIDPKEKFLWGKNYTANSEIKYEYYFDGIHSSYPDFIMMDSQGRVHIFEVKSVNKSGNASISLDETKYNTKILELESCYKEASKLTGHIFYLPILKDEDWNIVRYWDGERSTLTLEQFNQFVGGK